ncbi:MAG: hypothetical protein C0404_05520, partial [Verrucomicrobia bacterium]|nr:hypothetical protein [Verrucomicrobiota bacterium]
SGSVTYWTTVTPRLGEGERLFVSVSEYCGTAVRILVDGKTAGVLAWEPNELEITGFAVGQPVQLGLEVLAHRRNSHGPLHKKNKWPGWTGPAQFEETGDEWTDAYQLVPCGLMRPPRLIVRTQG